MSERIDPEATSGAPRAFYILPALMTLGNVFLGFFCIVKAFDSEFAVAASCLLFAGVLDRFDGLVARKTGTDSDFGRELDSLADVVSFGVAPAVLAFTWGLHLIPKLGWTAAFLFLTCGSLRLARYNVQPAGSDRSWFVGLPIPIAAGIPVTIVLASSVGHRTGVAPTETAPGMAWLLLVLMTTASFLMVSRFRYFAFKEVRFEGRRRNVVWLGLGLAIAAVAAWPPVALLVLAHLYVASGPALRLVSLLRRRTRGAVAESGPESDAGAEPAGAASPDGSTEPTLGDLAAEIESR